jgi:hypothetical protein
MRRRALWSSDQSGPGSNNGFGELIATLAVEPQAGDANLKNSDRIRKEMRT